jgi:hypothetical protein
VGAASLPGRSGQGGSDGVGEAAVGVGGDQGDARQAAGGQVAEERQPAGAAGRTWRISNSYEPIKANDGHAAITRLSVIT